MHPSAYSEARVLVVDDEQPNIVLLERMLEQWQFRNVVSTTDSSSVASACAVDPPDLILLDLHMPSPDGFEVMAQLRAWRAANVLVPILVLTADASSETRQRALAVGANDFLTKPFDPGEVRLRVRNLLEMRSLHLDLERQNVALERRVRERTADLERARLEILERLALAAEFRDDDTQEHAQRIGRSGVALARALAVEEKTVALIGQAAPLHDIGKIAIPDAILLKPGPLTDAEFAVVREHPAIGALILSGSESELLRMAEAIARTHHERWDGRGYPDRLSQNEIPLAGRIVAVADVFDALTHARPYKPAWPLADAIDEIRRDRGRHFDPSVVDAFLALDHTRLIGPVESVSKPLRAGPMIDRGNWWTGELGELTQSSIPYTRPKNA